MQYERHYYVETTLRRRFDVVITLLLRRVPAGFGYHSVYFNMDSWDKSSQIHIQIPLLYCLLYNITSRDTTTQ